jgi:hypothetical protein
MVGGTRRRRVALVLFGGALALVLTGCGRTTISGLHIHSGPSMSSPANGTLGPAGSAVDVRCWTRGEAVHGHTVWYRVSRPSAGYVTSYFVDTGGDAMAGTPAC